MRKKIYLIMLFTELLSGMDTGSSLFKPNYSFGNINLNYFDWSAQTQSASNRNDLSYIGYEGGASWDKIELYGFLNIENPTDKYEGESKNKLQFSSLVDVDFKLKNNFKLHIQNFSFQSESYYVNDLVLGFAYKIDTDFGLWWRPFVGVHHTSDTYYHGFNGYMGGWLLNYSFKIFQQRFSIFQWNEIEFLRDDKFYQDNNKQPKGDGASWGLNGALSFWIHLNDYFTVGTQYRYAKNKLGYRDYQEGIIYTIKYNF